MTAYLLTSGGCIVLFLGIYHLFLVGQKMYRFNRFFLLAGLIFALLAPLITIKVPAGTLPLYLFKSSQSENLKIKDAGINSLEDNDPLFNPDEVVKSGVTGVNATSGAFHNKAFGSTTQHINNTTSRSQLSLTTPASIHHTTSTFHITEILLAVYFLGLLVFIGRFVLNLYQIKKVIFNHEQVPFKDTALVLLSEPITPYSFLNYIFVSKQEYHKGAIEDELYTHELAHVHQKHSLDVIFIELIKIVFWFNPIFGFYKKAIQLNHEFLADDDVICTTDTVVSYQYLLLGKTLSNKQINLASGLNYAVTKRRLLMMVKESSVFRQRCTQILLLPVIIALFSFISISQKPSILSEQVHPETNKEAEIPKTFDTKIASGTKTQLEPQNTQTKTASLKLTKEIYYKASTIYRMNEHGRYIGKKYDEMSTAEKAGLPNVPLPRKRMNITQQMLRKWTTQPKTYGVWLDGKRVKNKTLATFSAADFSVYNLSRLTALAKNHSEHSFQLDLMTNHKYQEYYVEGQFLPGKTITITGDQVVPYRLLDRIKKHGISKRSDQTIAGQAKSEIK